MTKKASAEMRSGAVSLSDEERVTQVLVDSVLGLWDVVNNLTRLKPTRRDRYRGGTPVDACCRASAGQH